jgi:hypothetical protein
MASNWFEKHPKKSLFFLLLLFFLLITYSAEKFLEYTHRGEGFNFSLPYRAIVLREYRPSMTEHSLAGQKEKNYDSLTPKESLLRIDADGFIMPSRKYPHPDLSLVFLGGSTTGCRLVDEEQRFPYLTGVLCEQRFGIKVNSYNAGRDGNHSLHSLDILLNKICPLHPDIVIMLHNLNDLVVLLYEKSYWNQHSSRAVIFNVNDKIVANCFKVVRDRYIPNLAAELRNFDRRLRSLWKTPDRDGDEFARVRGQNLTVDPAALVKQFEMNLQSFIYLCQARNMVPVLMTMASRFKSSPDPVVLQAVQDAGLDYAQFKALFDLFNEAIRKKARENNILLIDLAREIPPDKEFLYDIVHFNDRGSRRAAALISEQLQPLVARLIRRH